MRLARARLLRLDCRWVTLVVLRAMAGRNYLCSGYRAFSITSTVRRHRAAIDYWWMMGVLGGAAFFSALFKTLADRSKR